jgi:hypothetical protein
METNRRVFCGKSSLSKRAPPPAPQLTPSHIPPSNQNKKMMNAWRSHAYGAEVGLHKLNAVYP